MKPKEFTALKKEIKNGNIEGLTTEAIKDFTITQLKATEDLLLDLELTEAGNKVLDTICEYIEADVKIKKVANKKSPAPKKEAPKKTAPEAPEATPEAPKKEATPKKAPKKPAKTVLKGNKEDNILDKIKVGSIIKFRVEDEEIENNIQIVNIGKYNVIGVMQEDEKEVFNIRKSDLKKQVFTWTDRHNEEYNIIVTI